MERAAPIIKLRSSTATLILFEQPVDSIFIGPILICRWQQR
jgi:hypothetical protein